MVYSNCNQLADKQNFSIFFFFFWRGSRTSRASPENNSPRLHACSSFGLKITLAEINRTHSQGDLCSLPESRTLSVFSWSWKIWVKKQTESTNFFDGSELIIEMLIIDCVWFPYSGSSRRIVMNWSALLASWLNIEKLLILSDQSQTTSFGLSNCWTLFIRTRSEVGFDTKFDLQDLTFLRFQGRTPWGLPFAGVTFAWIIGLLFEMK